jgi:transcriptional regulator with XRE-family HTH domain
VELGSSEDELDRAYAVMIATAIDYRIKSGLTQAALSKKSGLSSSMISKIEAQQSIPTLKTFLKYLQGIELDWAYMSKKRT